MDGWIKQIDGWLEGKQNYKKQMFGWMDIKNRLIQKWKIGWIDKWMAAWI